MLIRINLLPAKATHERSVARRQLLGGAIAVAAVLVGVGAFHGFAAARVAAARTEKTRLEADVAQLKSALVDYEDVQGERATLLRQKQAIDRLQRSRGGPAAVLRELSDILTRGKGPTFDRRLYAETAARDPATAFNPSWDPSRAWLLAYAEKNRSLRLRVGARSPDDVHELVKRLRLSVFFSEVSYQPPPVAPGAAPDAPPMAVDIALRVNE